MSKQSKPVSLLQAAQAYTQQPYEQSTLRQILAHFVEHAEATRVLIKELELMSKDLP